MIETITCLRGLAFSNIEPLGNFGSDVISVCTCRIFALSPEMKLRRAEFNSAVCSIANFEYSVKMKVLIVFVL